MVRLRLRSGRMVEIGRRTPAKEILEWFEKEEISLEDIEDSFVRYALTMLRDASEEFPGIRLLSGRERRIR